MQIRKINGEFVLKPFTNLSESFLERLVETGATIEITEYGPPATDSPCSDQSGRGDSMENTSDKEYSSKVVNSESIAFPVNHVPTDEELRVCECESPQYGEPHPSVHETEDEMKNHRSDQRILPAKRRLLSGD
ncbi:hypothetical protein [Microbulbifer discodermiae]|uniref:hypothetical protein n=1 Tax=Microbulbifer sp. 2201CG32-9 TaxID=3232309 RepID=UPI00345B9540